MGGSSRHVGIACRGRPRPRSGSAIGFGIDGDTVYLEFTQRSKNTARDSAAIGDQDFLEHEWGLKSSAGRPARRNCMPRSSAAEGRVSDLASALCVSQLCARAGATAARANQHDVVEPVANPLQFHIINSAGVGL